ncbi:dual oxidase maturation factor 1-like isoform X1 [Diadema antillarum]|uniref:dual oxidase maturation factor 1-like n=1 Tax=Diadema antillarum TaxID=105358 RepID=UPI003A8523A5
MGNAYTALRVQGLPTYYPSNKTAVTADVLEIGFIFAFVIVFFSFLVIIPGIRGVQRCYSLIRITISLFIGAGIMLSLWGQEWEKAELHDVTTFYKAFSTEEIEHADIEVKIGLNSVNITLRAPDGILKEYPDEIINYNERFNFYGGQGRNGFGRFSGRINREFREAQWSGKPYPVLWIAEYFTLDGEDIRWGRSYRMAGFYSYIMVWLAFPLWVLANILLFMVIRNGAYFLILTGGSLLTANVLYASIRYGSELFIPFSDEHILRFHKGPTFWLCLVSGLVSVISGFIVLVMDYLYPLEIATFFNVDPLQDFEETFMLDPGQGVDGEHLTSGKANGDGGEPAPAAPAQPKGRFEYRSRFQSRFAKSRRRPRESKRFNSAIQGSTVEEEEEEASASATGAAAEAAAPESSGPTSPSIKDLEKHTDGIPLERLDATPSEPTTDI